MYKYRINDLLAQLPMKDYRKALKIIPKALNISFNTFSNYRNIKIDDDQDIPHQKVLHLEKLFSLNAGELANFQPQYKSLTQLLAECEE
jgi:hypothetical protein